MADKLAKVFQSTWDRLMEQDQKALSSGDWAALLRADGGRRVLIHIASECGYSTEVKESKNGKGPAVASNQSGGKTETKETKGRRKSSIPSSGV